MSIVIIGGHDRMHREYKKVCKKYDCKAKIFTQMPASLKDQIGTPDAVVLFTKTVSHSMVRIAVKEASRKNIAVIRNHNSSIHALEQSIQSLI